MTARLVLGKYFAIGGSRRPRQKESGNEDDVSASGTRPIARNTPRSPCRCVPSCGARDLIDDGKRHGRPAGATRGRSRGQLQVARGAYGTERCGRSDEGLAAAEDLSGTSASAVRGRRTAADTSAAVLMFSISRTSAREFRDRLLTALGEGHPRGQNLSPSPDRPDCAEPGAMTYSNWVGWDLTQR